VSEISMSTGIQSQGRAGNEREQQHLGKQSQSQGGLQQHEQLSLSKQYQKMPKTHFESVSLKKNYYSLGNSGLKISPICLGAQNFSFKGGDRNGMKLVNESESIKILQKYVELGGNFIDVNRYGNCEAEKIVGKFIQQGNIRDKVVIATKISTIKNDVNPNAIGSGRKALRLELEDSLRNLQTTYIDLLYVHVWDRVTPPMDLMQTLNGFVKSGRVLHVALSQVPAWYVARCQSIAIQYGYAPITAIQLEYNLADRRIECEFTDLCLSANIALIAHAPLGHGYFTHKRDDLKKLVMPFKQFKEKYMTVTEENYSQYTFDKIGQKEESLLILEELEKVSKQLNRPVTELALNWALKRPAVVSIVVGAQNVEQLNCNVKSLEFEIPMEERKKLEILSLPDKGYPYAIFDDVQLDIKVQSIPNWAN